MALYYLFAAMAGGSFLLGGLMAHDKNDNDYLIYGFFGMVVFLIACALSAHAGM